MPWDRHNRIRFDPPTATGLRLIGERLRRRRQVNQLSQRQLEELSGLDQTVISRLENGRMSALRWTRFARLVAALGGLAESDPPIHRRRTLPRPEVGPGS